MSSKGAIKKTSSSKDDTKSNRKARPKASSEDNSEHAEKLGSSHTRKPQVSEHKGDGDRKSKLSQNSLTSRSQLHRTKQNISSQSRSNKQDSVSSSSKSSLTNSSVTHLKQSTVSSKIKSDNTKKVTNATVAAKSKPKDRVQPGYSEKRGTSTIYIPKSYTSRLNTKSTEKTMQTQRDKERLKNSEVSDRNKVKINSKERKKSRTLSPSEVRMIHSAVSRPSAAQEIVQQQATLDNKLNENNTQQETEGEYNYEDDFEDYESDFQECTDSDGSQVSEETNSSTNEIQLEPIELKSQAHQKVVHNAEHHKTEEDHMHDSGHYELAEARRRAARVELLIANQPKTPPLPELRQPANKAYSEDTPSENKSLPSSTDEGFEDSRSGDFAKSPPLSQISFIDFRKPKKDNNVKELQKPLSRGKQLVEMIKLDTMEWSLLECMPIPYEEFIRNYGKLNTQQMSTQTGEDNMDIETQTEEISYRNMWTQFPICCRKNLDTKENINLFRMEHIGVGSDDDLVATNFSLNPTFDILQLNEFLNRAGTVMLSLLEERRLGGNVFQDSTPELLFSDGFVKLSVNSVTFLTGRSVTVIHYSEILSKVLLTIHAPAEEEIETSSKQDYITDCCIGCVWNISEPSMPTKLFYSQCPITACCFHLTNYNVVFAGLEDGSINLWDLREDTMWHQKVTDKANELDWTIRTPTYTTAANDDINGHNSQIIAIRVLSKIEVTSLRQRNDMFVPIQICSLDEEGNLIIWSILPNMGINIDDLGLSQWGDIRLVKSQQISLRDRIKKKKRNTDGFIDMQVDCVDTNNLYIATNTTNVLHVTCMGNKTTPLTYKKADMSACGGISCIERCPFEKSYFWVGCDDGTIRLHSSSIEKPVLQVRDKHCLGGIKTLQWSRSKPLTIYVLDNNTRMHIWDLSNSDIYPSYNVSLKNMGDVKSMQLSPCKTEQDMNNQYLAFGMGSGNVEVHKLKKDFCYTKKEDTKREINTFLRFVTIL